MKFDPNWRAIAIVTALWMLIILMGSLTGCPTTKSFGYRPAPQPPQPTVLHLRALRRQVATVIEDARLREDTPVVTALLPVQEYLGFAVPAEDVAALRKENTRLSNLNMQHEAALATWRDAVGRMGLQKQPVGSAPTGGPLGSLFHGLVSSLGTIVVIAALALVIGGSVVGLFYRRLYRRAREGISVLFEAEKRNGNDTDKMLGIARDVAMNEKVFNEIKKARGA